jgi:hypothetical protein
MGKVGIISESAWVQSVKLKHYGRTLLFSVENAVLVDLFLSAG